MKKTTIILSVLMVMALSNGILYAEQGDGKPLEMGKTEVSMQEKTGEMKGTGEKKENRQMETKQEAAHRHAQERSEER